MADAEATAAIAPRGAASYDHVAQTVHWLIAALALTVIWLGWGIAWAPRNTPRRDLFVLIHESVGLTILAAMVFRAWWRWRHSPPPLPPALSRLETGLAGLTHFALYLLLILMPIAGYSSAAAAGHAVSYFGVFSIPRYCRVMIGCRKWRSRSICSGNTRYISLSSFTSRGRCSMALSNATESSSA